MSDNRSTSVLRARGLRKEYGKDAGTGARGRPG